MLLSPLFFGWLLASGASPHGTDLRDEKGRLESEIARGASSDIVKWAAEEQKKQDEIRNYLVAFRIEDAGDGCLAYDHARQDCAVTISEFNKSGTLYQFQPPEDTSDPGDFQARIAKARETMLRSLLEPRFLASRLEDSLQAPDFRERWRSAEAKEPAYAKAERDTALQQLYKTYYSAHFSARDSLIVQYLAATDSTLLDSLWRTDPGNPSCQENGVRDPDRKCRGKTRLAWHIYSQPLPQEVRQRIERSPLGVTAGPFRAPFGFLLLKPVQRVKIPELSFRACLPLLIDISNLERWAGKDGKLPPGLATGPAAPQEKYSFWLWPAPAFGKKTGHDRTLFPASFDTLACKPLRLSRAALPASIRLGLDRLGPLHPGEFIPFRWGEFGVWAFRMDKPETTVQAAPKALKPLPRIASRAEDKEALFATAQERWAQKSASKEAGRFRTYLYSRPSSAPAVSGYEREFNDWIGADIEILSRL